MLTPYLLSATWKTLAHLLTSVTSWKTSGRVKASGTSSTPTATSQRSSSPRARGTPQLVVPAATTRSTLTTSGSTPPGWFVTSPTPAQPQAGRTAGTSGRCRDLTFWEHIERAKEARRAGQQMRSVVTTPRAGKAWVN